MIRTGKTDSLAYVTMDAGDLAGAYGPGFPVHPANEHLRGTCNRDSTGMDSAWYGGIRTQAEADAMILSGWSDGAQRLSDLSTAIAPDMAPAKSIKRRLRWTDTSGEIDVDRALAGDALIFREPVAVRVTGPRVVRIVAPWGQNAGHDANSLFWTSAGAVVLADVLEDAGYAAEICVCLAGTSDSRLIGVSFVTVKSAGETPSLPHIAAIASHAGIFRTYGFQSILAQPHGLGHSIGSKTSFPKSQMIEAGILDPGDIVLGEARDRASCLSVIRDAVARIETAHAA